MRLFEIEDIQDGPEWIAILAHLRPRFPAIPRSVQDALSDAPTDIPANGRNDPASLRLRNVRGRLQMELIDPKRSTTVDRHRGIVQSQELRAIASASNLFPHPIWLSRGDGTLSWANDTYGDLSQRAGLPAIRGEPALPAFDINLPDDQQSITTRAVLETGGKEQANWFDVTKIRSGRNSFLSFAIDVNAVVEAEIAQHRFVQTLTKTFAQLSTGLAIFDRNRQLALFNPALIDLTALPADFLSSRPNMLSFFDRLRESRMMPEPKNYATWRQHIADLVIAASDGRYHETWSLPSGLTYRVTGRPHPDGAIAILIEDISAEISLTRRFRSQLDMGQAVIDTLDEAIAVFTSSGALTFSNAAFRNLWKLDPDNSFAEMTLQDATRQWKTMAASTPFWARLDGFVTGSGNREEWFSDITLKDGTPVECRVTPIGGGATLVGFRLHPFLEPGNAPATSG